MLNVHFQFVSGGIILLLTKWLVQEEDENTRNSLKMQWKNLTQILNNKQRDLKLQFLVLILIKFTARCAVSSSSIITQTSFWNVSFHRSDRATQVERTTRKMPQIHVWKEQQTKREINCALLWSFGKLFLTVFPRIKWVSLRFLWKPEKDFFLSFATFH